MKKTFKKSEYFLAATLALIAGFPLAVYPPSFPTESVLGASLVAGINVQEKALDNYKNYRDNRRDYQKATALCEKLRGDDKDVDCPSINDSAGIQYFLKTHENVPAPAAMSGKIVQSMEDLTPYDQNLIRWYQKANVCPVSMKEYLPGFYELCQSVLRLNRVRGRTVITGPNGAESEPAATLDEIIRANKGIKRTW